MSDVYELTGKELKNEFIEKVECGDIVTTQYFLDGALVRQDKNVIVDAAWLALQGLIR